jgi:hypothetical protein
MLMKNSYKGIRVNKFTLIYFYSFFFNEDNMKRMSVNEIAKNNLDFILILFILHLIRHFNIHMEYFLHKY